MTNDKGIYIKNIYYMLSYAFQVLKHSNYESVAAEEFGFVQDLFAAILAKGVAKQLKQGELLQMRGAGHDYREEDWERAGMLLRTWVLTGLN